MSKDLHKVVLTRRFDAAPDAVWRAWTDADALGEWFGETIEADVRVGGRYRAENRDGETVFIHAGEYLALEPNRLLHATFTVPNAPKVEHDFSDEFIEVRLAPADGGTAMTFINGWQGDPMPADDRKAVEEAWSGWLDLLAGYLERSDEE